MIVDSSAVLAILFAEPDAEMYARAIAGAPECRMSVANWLEAAVRIDRLGQPAASDAFDEFLRLSGIELVPVDVEQARLAREAYSRYGRGTGHTAGLNFGDCFAYALARRSGEPLLFKGNDFPDTDVDPAIRPAAS